ncbi:UNVERIFIED_CONTAM: hypothetical protein Sangu_0899800 [Sesamum angustifolium]|uniref:Uncharacterized protein n=1 Tax=Sesamum angustifolium TaxID=2727405 RepID=A0AAW2PDE8_9LAMI
MKSVIICLCEGLWLNIIIAHDEDIVQDYYEAPSVPQVYDEPTSAGHVEGIPDDSMRSYPVDAGTSSYVYGGSDSYDYDESGLIDRFFNVVHVADQPLWDGCNQSQLGVVAGLPGDYYNMKKLVNYLNLPVEKIHACKNGCMLYCKDNVDLEYCKFCRDGRYKPARGRDLNRKKSPYAVLRYLPLTPRLQRYSSRATAEHMPHIKQQRGRCVIHPMSRRGSILTGYILILQKSRVMFG